MRWPSLLVISLLVFPSCFFDCLGDGGGGTGGGSGGSGESLKLDYDLVEATGEWSVTGTSSQGTCVNTTTSAKITLSLSKPDTKAVTFAAKTGTVMGYVDLDATIGARQGMTQCATGTPQPCPTFPGTEQKTTAFIGLTTPTPLAADAPDGAALIPVLSGPLPPYLCDNGQYDLSGVELRGRPVTVAELKSGRFVVEGSGTTPLLDPPYDPTDPSSTTVAGTMTYSFRLVFQTATYNPANAVTPPAFTTFDECINDLMPTGAELAAARDAFADGGTDLALNAHGCRRVIVERSGADETVSQVLTRGTKLVYDAASGTSHGERDTVTLYRRVRDATGLHESHDLDQDGFFEATDDTTFAAGVWQSTVSRDFAPNSTTVTRQLTRTRVDATTMNVRIEVGGQLADEFTTPTRQEACFDQSSMTDPQCAPPPQTNCGGATDACDETQTQKVLDDLKSALKKGKECMKGVGFDSFQPGGKGLTMIATKKLKLLCSTNPCAPYGYYEQVANDDGTHDFMVNVVKNNPAEMLKTLYHEMLHSDPRFTHDDTLDKLSVKACKLQITDRTYACETMCFAPNRGGSCACVKCLNPNKSGEPPKEICDKCDKFGACPGRRGPREDGGIGNISQGVGAYCERGRTFCDTKTECDKACTIGSCTKIKTVCDPTCN